MNTDMNVESAIQRFAYSLGAVLGALENEDVKERLKKQYGSDISALEHAVKCIYSAMRKES